MGKRSVGRALFLGAFVAGIALACAQGGEIPNVGGSAGSTSSSSSSSSSGTGGTDGGAHGQIGSPCKSNADCDVGSCAPIGGGSYCTQACPPACPSGSYCSIINGASICVPDLDQQCTECAAVTDCKLPSDACLTAPPGDKFCARDCTVDGTCPNGFTCLDLESYLDADGGAPDAGGGDAGADAGDAGGPKPTAPFKWCVPNSGFSCPCNDKRDGVTHACSLTTASGTCQGQETCNGAKGAWEGCTAKAPSPEACNNADDDCNGMIDDGDPNALCASEGPKPPHASWACKTGTCSLGACDPGWTNYPPGTPQAGCACPVEAGEPNGTCGTATNAGQVTDTGAPITLSGTLSSPNDIDVWTFDAVDVDEVNTNSYHVAIGFTAPAANSEFVMDVIRGDACTDTPTGPATAITAYDWCVNASDGASPPSGELNCGPTAPVRCGGTLNSSATGSHTSKYFVRVYRKPGATGTCTPYTITVSGGGGACDLTRKCP